MLPELTGHFPKRFIAFGFNLGHGIISTATSPTPSVLMRLMSSSIWKRLISSAFCLTATIQIAIGEAAGRLRKARKTRRTTSPAACDRAHRHKGQNVGCLLRSACFAPNPTGYNRFHWQNRAGEAHGHKSYQPPLVGAKFYAHDLFRN